MLEKGRNEPLPECFDLDAVDRMLARSVSLEHQGLKLFWRTNHGSAGVSPASSRLHQVVEHASRLSPSGVFCRNFRGRDALVAGGTPAPLQLAGELPGMGFK